MKQILLGFLLLTGCAGDPFTGASFSEIEGGAGADDVPVVTAGTGGAGAAHGGASAVTHAGTGGITTTTGGASSTGGTTEPAGGGAAAGDAGSSGATEGGEGGVGGSGDVEPQPVLVGTGKITYRRWDGISGWSVEDVPVGSQGGTMLLTELRDPGGDNGYGSQFTGFITAPESGFFAFWIACRHNCDLQLSTDESTEKLRKIAFVDGEFSWTDADQWDKYSRQQSDRVQLVAGKRYRISVRLMQYVNHGAGNLSVAWTRPDGTREPVPSKQLSP